MGSDNIFHKRKQQKLSALQRKTSKREPYDIVLMVCEGEKGEPLYLQSFCHQLKLHTANFKILGEGVDPLTIVDRAQDEYNKNKKFNRVYCIFDQDEHASYQQAINKIELLRGGKKEPIPIYAITSVPCFEYWLILHYSDSTRPYSKKGKKSAGRQLKDELETHIQDYEKKYKHIFEITKEHLKTAIDRAKKVHFQQAINGNNPSTNFHELIEYLSNLKK